MEYKEISLPAAKSIALVAHDNRKKDLLAWCQKHRADLSRHTLFATGTTGTLIEKETGLVLGAHLLSWDAAETINMFVMAMCGKLDCETLKGMIFTYPSWASDIKAMV